MFGDLEVRLDPSPDGGATLFVSGEVDRSTSGRLRNEIAAAASQHEELAVDVDGVTYLDSSAIAVLFDAVRVSDAAIVATPRCLVRPTLEVTGLPLRDE